MKKKAASKSTKRAKSAKSVKASPPSDATASETPVKTAEAPAAAVVAAEPASSAKPAKPPRKRAAKKTSIRYTPEAKAKILQFVRNHDAANGRGGRSAAVRKFGVTALTLSKWMKAKGAGMPEAAKATAAPTAKVAPTPRRRAGRPAKEAKSSGSAAGSIKAALNRMLEIRNQIDALSSEFEDLKTQI